MHNEQQMLTQEEQEQLNQQLFELIRSESSLEQIQDIINKGANANAKDEDDYTPLHYAARFRITGAVELLIENGANVNTKDNSGSTPLHHAAKSGHTDTISLLIQNGTDINARDEYGITPLHWAAESEVTEACELLIQHGANINAQGSGGQTPLHRASYFGRIGAMELLIQHGTNINAQARDGQTPLHQASNFGGTGAADLLIQHGAEVNTLDACNQTPLFHAALLNQHETAKILIESGKCDLSARDRQGNNIWTYYAQDPVMAEILMANGAEYQEKEPSEDLLRIVNNSQGAHESELALKTYQELEEQYLKKQLEGSDFKAHLNNKAEKVIKELKKAQDELGREGYLKIIKSLIGLKISVLDGTDKQGLTFIAEVAEKAGLDKKSTTKRIEELKTDAIKLAKQETSNAITEEEKQKNAMETLKEALKSEIIAAIDSSSPEQKDAVAQYAKEQIEEGIEYCCTPGYKPFASLDATIKDFLGIVGIKLETETSAEEKETRENVINAVLSGILDAKTMYESGSASCAQGTATIIINETASYFIKDEPKKETDQSKLPIPEVRIYYDALLELVAERLDEKGETELARKLTKQSKLTAKFQKTKDQAIKQELSKHGLSSIEVQKVATQVYQMLKQPGFDISKFIESTNVALEQLPNILDHKSISKITYGGLFSATENAAYIQNVENFTEMCEISEKDPQNELAQEIPDIDKFIQEHSEQIDLLIKEVGIDKPQLTEMLDNDSLKAKIMLETIDEFVQLARTSPKLKGADSQYLKPVFEQYIKHKSVNKMFKAEQIKLTFERSLDVFVHEKVLEALGINEADLQQEGTQNRALALYIKEHSKEICSQRPTFKKLTKMFQQEEHFHSDEFMHPKKEYQPDSSDDEHMGFIGDYSLTSE